MRVLKNEAVTDHVEPLSVSFELCGGCMVVTGSYISYFIIKCIIGIFIGIGTQGNI